MKKKKLISIRVNEEQLKRLSKALGIDESKTIRACMNLTENVILRWFGGEVTHIFKRKKDNEEQNLYSEWYESP